MKGPTYHQISSLKYLCTGQTRNYLCMMMLAYKFACDDAHRMMPSSRTAADMAKFAELAWETARTPEGTDAMIADAAELLQDDIDQDSIGYHIGLGLGG